MTLQHGYLTTLLLIATSSMGRAECLTPADLDKGIRITFENADWTEIRRIDGDIYDVYEYYANVGWGNRYIAYQGLVPEQGIRQYRPDDQTGAIPYWRDFTVEPADMADFSQTGAGGTFVFTEIYEGGVKVKTDFSLAVSEAPTVDVPGCSYDATLVQSYEAWANPTPDNTTTWSFYLTDLEVSFLFAAKSKSGNLASSAAISIERLD